jgi:hypothetical protein
MALSCPNQTHFWMPSQHTSPGGHFQLLKNSPVVKYTCKKILATFPQVFLFNFFRKDLYPTLQKEGQHFPSKKQVSVLCFKLLLYKYETSQI